MSRQSISRLRFDEETVKDGPIVDFYSELPLLKENTHQTQVDFAKYCEKTNLENAEEKRAFRLVTKYKRYQQC